MLQVCAGTDEPASLYNLFTTKNQTDLFSVYSIFRCDIFRCFKKAPLCPQLLGSEKDFSMHVSIYECESTGGSEWVLEQTLHLDDFTRPSSTLDPRVSVDSNLFVYSRSGGHCLCLCVIFCQPLYAY